MIIRRIIKPFDGEDLTGEFPEFSAAFSINNFDCIQEEYNLTNSILQEISNCYLNYQFSHYILDVL